MRFQCQARSQRGALALLTLTTRGSRSGSPTPVVTSYAPPVVPPMSSAGPEATVKGFMYRTLGQTDVELSLTRFSN